MADATKAPLTVESISDVGSHAWVNPTYAEASDNSGATSDIDPYNSSYWLRATNFDFGSVIPSGSTINGVTVYYTRKAGSSSAIKDSAVKLVVGLVVSGDDKADTITSWSTTFETVYRGGSGDLWGLSLTDNDVRSLNFGVVISAVCQDASTVTAEIDFIEVTVSYTPPPWSDGAAAAVLTVSGVSAVDSAASGSSAAALTSSADGKSDASGIGSSSATSAAAAESAVESFAVGSASASLTATAAARIIELPSQSATCVLPTSQSARSVLKTSWNAKAGIWRN